MLVKLSDISIPKNRQRTEIDPEAVARLAESFEHVGQLHAVVLRRNEPLFNGWELVAGETRMKAKEFCDNLGMKVCYEGEEVPPGMIAASDIKSIPYLHARRAELEENIRRTDLSWQDKARATAELEELMRAENEEKGLPPPTIAEVAIEARGSAEGIHHATTRKEIILARNLDNPVVAGAKTAKDAFKALKRQENLQRHATLAAALGKSFTGQSHTLQHGDSLLLLSQVPGETFDCILTDPPYGMGADQFGDGGGAAPGGGHIYSDDYEDWRILMEAFGCESFRVAKAQAHAYIFCDFTRFAELRGFMEKGGWKVFRTPLIWHKPNGNRIPWVDRGPQRRFEIILFASKGDKLVNSIQPDVITVRSDENLGHQAQKPVLLYTDLLKRSVQPGARVLDPFCGTGPIFPAAHELKVLATGMELAAESYGIAAERIRGLK